MFIEYFIYFFAGIVVARISKSKESVNLPSLIKTLFHPISFMVILFISYLLFINTTHLYNTLVILLLSIPFGFIVYGIFDNTTALSRFFSNKIVVFLGTISYSLYICSTTLIDGMHSLYSPTNVIVSVLFAILTVLITVLVSYVMHQIIEAPYFMFKPNKHEYAPTPHKLGITLLLLIIFVIITIFSAYSSQFNFFSSIASYGNKQVTINVPMKGEMEITENPLTISFTAHDNNLGVILLRFTTSPGKKQKLIVKVVEKGSSIVLASQETTMEIGDNVSYQIGVPVILNSLGKNYIIELSIKKGDSQSIIFLHTNPSVLQTVQQLDKKNLITHPFKLISHVIDKVQALITNRTAFLVMLCVFPLLISTLFI